MICSDFRCDCRWFVLPIYVSPAVCELINNTVEQSFPNGDFRRCPSSSESAIEIEVAHDWKEVRVCDAFRSWGSVPWTSFFGASYSGSRLGLFRLWMSMNISSWPLYFIVSQRNTSGEQVSYAVVDRSHRTILQVIGSELRKLKCRPPRVAFRWIDRCNIPPDNCMSLASRKLSGIHLSFKWIRDLGEQI